MYNFPFFVLLNAFSFWKATYIQLLSIKYRDSELCAISSFFWSKLTFKGKFLLNMQLHLRKKTFSFQEILGIWTMCSFFIFWSKCTLKCTFPFEKQAVSSSKKYIFFQLNTGLLNYVQLLQKYIHAFFESNAPWIPLVNNCRSTYCVPLRDMRCKYLCIDIYILLKHSMF
jgi:hypothetical protein